MSDAIRVERDRFQSLPNAILTAAAILVVSLSLARIVVFWQNEAYLNTVSGVWTAMASDLSEGTFYRPLFGPLGYGGTRYFPLHVLLHAALIKVVGDPILGGHLLAALSVAGVVIGVWAVLRAIGATCVIALSSAALTLASQTTQQALLSIRGDALPAALNLLGVALAVRPGAPTRRIVAAALLFTLAFAAKPTAVYGVVASAVWLFATRRRDVSVLAGATLFGALLVLVLLYAASAGRAADALWMGASAGAGVRDLLMAPLTLARLARQVPETLVFIELGVAAAVTIVVGARSALSVPVLLFVAAGVAAIPIFALPGTDTNHLIDITAASLVTLGGSVAIIRSREASFATIALAVAGLAASLSLMTGIANRNSEQRRGTFAEALALIPPEDPRPILAENPLVPLAAGERPYMLDAYMFRLLNDVDGTFGNPLDEALRGTAFSAVVLERNPHDARGQDWYATGFFGEGFVDEVERHYAAAGTIGTRVVYLPRPQPIGRLQPRPSGPVSARAWSAASK